MVDHADPVPRAAGRPAGPPDPAESAANAALELAMRVGEALSAAGMSANDVVVRMLRIAAAYGLTRVHVDVTYTSISVTQYRERGTAPLTFIRVVKPADIDYTKVREIDKLSDDVEAGLPVDRALAVFERIRAAPHPYP